MKSSDKPKRLAAIIRLVDEKQIDGQDQLLNFLRLEGFNVTQATLSRDVKELKIVKIPDGSGGYRYTRHPADVQMSPSVPPSGVVSVEVSGQVAVVRTRPGYASVTAATIDDARLRHVMGTIAGDDTVLVVLRVDAPTDAVLEELRKVVPNIADKVL